MTDLKKPIHRTSTARRRERGQDRRIIASMLPPAFVGFRLAGTRQTFLLDIEVAYELALKQQSRDIERLAARIQKHDHCRMASARKQAEKAVRDETVAILHAAQPEKPKKAKLKIECCLYHAKGGAQKSCRIPRRVK